MLNTVSNVNTNLLTYTKTNNSSAVLNFNRVNFEKDAAGTLLNMKVKITGVDLNAAESN